MDGSRQWKSCSFQLYWLKRVASMRAHVMRTRKWKPRELWNSRDGCLEYGWNMHRQHVRCTLPDEMQWQWTGCWIWENCTKETNICRIFPGPTPNAYCTRLKPNVKSVHVQIILEVCIQNICTESILFTTRVIQVSSNNCFWPKKPKKSWSASSMLSKMKMTSSVTLSMWKFWKLLCSRRLRQRSWTTKWCCQTN